MEDRDEGAASSAPSVAPAGDTSPVLCGTGEAGRPAAKFTAALGRAICARVASGESQMALCAEAGMPSRATLRRWVQAMPKFAAELQAAREAGGVARTNGRLSTFCQATADEIFRRLAEGEPLISICADPAMPCFSTVYYWRKQFPDFAAAMRTAREIQAERFCETGWEIAKEITPEVAYASHVKLTQLRWMAGVLSPKRFGRMKPADPAEAGQGGDFVVVLKRYSDAPVPELGRPLEPGESFVLRRDPMGERDD